MPRQSTLLTVIRNAVQGEVRSAIQSLLAGMSGTKSKAKNGRRRRRKGRGKWRPGGPGRPPKAIADKAAKKKAVSKGKIVRQKRRRKSGRPRAPKKAA